MINLASRSAVQYSILMFLSTPRHLVECYKTRTVTGTVRVTHGVQMTSRSPRDVKSLIRLQPPHTLAPDLRRSRSLLALYAASHKGCYTSLTPGVTATSP